MHDETSKPPLTVINGGKGAKPKAKRDNAEKSDKLTERQEKFAQGLAAGLTNSESYRQAYGAENMKPSTIHSESCRQAAHPKVIARVDELLREKRAKHIMFEGKASDRVWRNVWRLAEGENVPPSVQQAAVALAAKMAGMLTDKVEIENISTDSKSIETELLQRLQRLTG